ncbi:dehydrogenase/reductase SDR family member 4-like [Anneissia japonica]|uniref:dehydrogenase/reductase SDR family member 4-like n=1 Tax=Anneissia japonica TaxID=1529436 RepID=UPI0014256D71|nr:dehydrogenase/reductase SDR family member 4-like [Anneissia japonica]
MTMVGRRALIFLQDLARSQKGAGIIGARCTSTMASVPKARRLEGKVAIVTASSDGIGFAIARRLGQEGAHVVVSSRKENNVDRAVNQLKSEDIKVSGMVCHVAKADHRQRLINKTVEDYGGIDIFVSNAAVNPVFGPILDTSEAAWEKIFDVNVKATFLMIKDAVPHMEKRGGGSVVIVSSIGGYVPFEYLGPYSVSKTALFGLTKALAPQCAGMGIRVNALAPGVIKTKFSEALWKNEAASEQFLSMIPMKRIGLPEECAGTVAFLCSDDGSYMTGETLVIAGGMSARL